MEQFCWLHFSLKLERKQHLVSCEVNWSQFICVHLLCSESINTRTEYGALVCSPRLVRYARYLRLQSRTSQVMECEWRKRETNYDRKKSKKKIIKIKQMCCKRRRSACNCISDNTSYCLPVDADSVCVSCLRVFEYVCMCPRCSSGYSSPNRCRAKQNESYDEFMVYIISAHIKFIWM